MGTSSSKAKNLTVDDYVQKIREECSVLSERDRRLYNVGKIKIADGDLDGCKIHIGFQDQEPFVLSGVEDTSGEVSIGYNGSDEPQLVWQKRGFWRNFKCFWIGCFKRLKGALSRVVRLAIAAVRLGAIANH